MNRGNVILENPQRFEEPYEISREKINSAIDHALTKLSSKISKYGNLFPAKRLDPPFGRVYEMGENESWT